VSSSWLAGLHPPPPGCRDGHRIPVSMRESLEGLLTDPRKPQGEAASAAVAGIGDGRGRGVRARQGAGGRTGGELDQDVLAGHGW